MQLLTNGPRQVDATASHLIAGRFAAPEQKIVAAAVLSINAVAEDSHSTTWTFYINSLVDLSWAVLLSHTEHGYCTLRGIIKIESENQSNQKLYTELRLFSV